MCNEFVLINTIDNVLICCQSVNSGETITVSNRVIHLTSNITVGHKIARFSINKGDKIIRYGVPIGSATEDINIGEHVHLQNMKSDYIPSHTRQSKSGD